MALRPEDLPKDPAALAEMVLAFDGENDDLRAEIATLKGLIFGARSERSAIICAEQLALDLERTADAQPPANDDEPESDAPRPKRRKAPAQHRRAAGASAPGRTGDRAGFDALPVLHGPDASDRRGDERSARSGSGVAAGAAHDPSQIRLPGLRGPDRPGPGAGAAGRGRHGDDGADRAHRRGQIRLAVDALSSGADPGGPRRRRRPSDAGALDGERGVDGQGPLRSAAEDHAWLRAAVLRRDADAGARPGTRPHEDLPVLGACDDDRAWKGPAPPAVAYVFAGGRGKKEIVAQLAGFEGVLQVDGYAAYVSLAGDAKMSGKVRLAYCLVHARRNFVKVHKTTNSPFAREVIERIAAVYAIEDRIRGLDAGERRAARQAETKPLMEALKARLVAVKDGISRRSTLIKAIDYMLERWEGLTAFLDDGRLEPDTNTVERSIRPIAIGKKNSLFSGDEGGGETWAILSSLLNTARLNGVDPEAYLVDVLERMVSGATKNNRLHELLVWNWKAAREAERRAAA